MKNSSSIWTNSLTYGLLTGVISVIYSLLIYFLDLTFSLTTVNSVVSIAIFALGIYLGTKNLRDKYQAGQLSYGRGLGSGTLIALFTAIIVAIYTYLLYTVIDPDLMNKSLQFTEEKLLQRGLSEDQVATMMTAMQERMRPWKTVVWSVPLNVLLGFIVSLIVAAILKKDDDSFGSTMAEVEEQK